MSNSFLGYQNPTTTDKKLDSESLTVGSNTVERERVQISGAADTEIARVKNSEPASTDHGLVVREVQPTSIVSARKNLTTNAERLAATNTPCRQVTIMADPDNTGYISIGDANIVASQTVPRGILLAALNSITIPIDDIYKIYAVAEIEGDGISYIYV